MSRTTRNRLLVGAAILIIVVLQVAVAIKTWNRPDVVEKVVTVVVTKEVEVEKVVTREIEKVVTKEVEKVVKVTPAPSTPITTTQEVTATHTYSVTVGGGGEGKTVDEGKKDTVPAQEPNRWEQLGYSLIETTTVEVGKDSVTWESVYAVAEFWIKSTPIEYTVKRDQREEQKLRSDLDLLFVRSDGKEAHLRGVIAPEVMAGIAQRWDRPPTKSDFTNLTAAQIWGKIDPQQTALFTVDDRGLIWDHSQWSIGFAWKVDALGCKAGGKEMACSFFAIMPAGLQGFLPDYLVSLVTEGKIDGIAVVKEKKEAGEKIFIAFDQEPTGR